MTSIAELRRLEAGATPGPWSVDRHFVVGPRLDTDDQSHGMINGVADIYGPNRSKDAALIVAMRNALPELLKALEDRDLALAELESLKSAIRAMSRPLPPHGGVDVG